MECVYCCAVVKGFIDSRIVVIQGHKCIACADIDACNGRTAERERERTGMATGA